ncbi:MAG: PhoU domain-containing protein [Promethearchaeota archaeon]
MQTRKIQKTGGSSYIVSLPKKWAESHDVKERKEIGMVILKDGNLVLIPRDNIKFKQKVKEINMENVGDESLLFRLLVASYHQGYNVIKIISKKRLEIKTRNTIKNFIRSAIGLEIMEETANNIKIKDLLNPSERNFMSWLERISQLVTTQLEDTLLALKNKDESISNEVINRDQEVNRINWLISRQYNIVSNNIILTETSEVGKDRIVNFTAISRIIERVGDHAVKIAENNINIIDEEIDPSLINDLLKLGKRAIHYFNSSIRALMNNNIKAANDNIESIKELTTMCNELEKRIVKLKKSSIAISIGSIIESIRRCGEYSADLSEFIINFLIDDY